MRRYRRYRVGKVVVFGWMMDRDKKIKNKKKLFNIEVHFIES